MGKTDSFDFQSEVKQLLNILVYSLYKHKDVFLRELLSNAVDALNKIKFELLTSENLPDKDLDLRIDISITKSQNKLIVEDTGVGMTRDELIENIGTIAHSGTGEFFKKLAESKGKEQLDLIGKFGVGFYASFMVAQEIRIITKSFQPGSKAYLWKSEGGSSYTIEETVKKHRGTRIELIIKKEEKEFLDKERIQTVINKHSRFVPFPVYIEKEKLESVEAIWSQPKTSLKPADYIEFYKFFENSQEEPETYIHLSSDAPVQFNAIIYVPKSSLETLGLFKTPPGVDLYSRKVLIQKASEDILPDYLRFIKGVIDSEEIPLNISRETIQDDIKIAKIRKHVVKKLFDHLKKIKEKDQDQFLRIWEHFSRFLKEGVTTDYENRDRIAPLLLFHSSKQKKGEYTDLDDYISRMDKEQKNIYYVTGMDIASLQKNPALEAFSRKDIEVLYLIDPLDEIVVDHLREYGGKKLTMAESADIKLDEETAEGSKDIDNFVGYLKTIYGDRIADVKVSRRLVDSPCILVNPGEGPSVQMEKIMKMVNKEYSFSKRIFEINPNNTLIHKMIALHKAQPASEKLKTLALQLLDNMMLREGVIDHIDDVILRIQDIMLAATGGQ